MCHQIFVIVRKFILINIAIYFSAGAAEGG